MNYKIFILIFLFLYSCSTNQVTKKQIIQTETYLNKGFTLLYKDNLKKKSQLVKKLTKDH